MKLINQLQQYIQAGYTCFYLHSAETARVDDLVKNVASRLHFNVLEINLACGFVDFYNKSEKEDNDGRLENSLKALYDQDLEETLILIKNIKQALEHNPLAISRLQFLIEKIERHHQKECAIILQSAEVYIPADLEPFITLIELPLPKEQEIESLFADFDIDTALKPRLITALSGLNEAEIQKLLMLMQNKFGQFNEGNQTAIFDAIQYQKEQIIAKSGVLEMVSLDSSIEDIGGLEQLKSWLGEQQKILTHFEQAKAFGVKAPKGTLIAGMPGCGKSLTAKAAAQLFQQPLLRLDIGSLLGKYVGESEGNMRKALAMAEGISPCVLWVDELEKAFVGMNGNNASEVSSRLLGYFLTWMQEKTAPVFVVATANDITVLPPELLRKGRFDEIFYVGFPNKTERQQILKIHLQKAKQTLNGLRLEDLAQLCRDYSGADIENAVSEAVKYAFLAGNTAVSQADLRQAIDSTTPLRKTLKEKVGEYEKKFNELFLKNASIDDGLSVAQLIKMADNPNYLKRIEVAESDNVTEELLEKLSTDKNLEVRKAVFSNPLSSKELLDKQISLKEGDKYYNSDLLEIIAKHRNVSFDLACEYLNEYSSEVKAGFANNPYITKEVQHQLANDYSRDVRKALAQNVSINYQAQLILIKGSDEEVKKALASNPVIHPAIQLFLAEANHSVKKELARNIAITERVQLILTKSDDEIKIILASNKGITKKTQALLARDGNFDVKMRLSINPALDNNIKKHTFSSSKDILFLDDTEVFIIDIYVKVGDIIKAGHPIISVESDKAIMDYPTEVAGIVQEIFVKESDLLKKNTLIMRLLV
ncbi:TPA: AAA family ATPase [Pasteurella multocida]|nr:AAA family ATPase [Pasteurella multocida]